MLKIFLNFIILILFVNVNAQRQLPIIAFQGVPESYTNDFNYSKLKSAGFNVNLNMYSSIEKAIKALEIGEKSGVKLILSVPNLKDDTENIVNILKKYPALLGYYIEDEPSTLRFHALSEIVEKIKKVDPIRVTYINLFPTYAEPQLLQAKDYQQYVDKYFSVVKPNIISFDHYSVINNTIRKDFYENLDIIRSYSKKNNLPFWAFACSVIHFEYKEPTLAAIKLQQFSNLLYGAYGLQYYSYWSVNDLYWKQNNYSYAIVDEIGKPTLTYNIVKTVNEQIQRLSWVFFRAKSDAVFHTGNEIPLGTKRLTLPPKRFKYFSTNGRNALVSFMTNKKNKFIIIQNKSLDEDLVLNYQLEKPVKVVENISGRTKSITSTNKLKTNILPGDILIFTYDN